MAHNEPSHLDLQYLPSSLCIFNILVYIKSLSKFCRHNFVVCFFCAFRVKIQYNKGHTCFREATLAALTMKSSGRGDNFFADEGRLKGFFEVTPLSFHGSLLILLKKQNTNVLDNNLMYWQFIFEACQEKKFIFRDSDQVEVRHKMACSATATSLCLEIQDIETWGRLFKVLLA